MEIIVQKFGGSSLASVCDIKRCVEFVAQSTKEYSIVVVVSAMGTFTDTLSELLLQFSPNYKEADIVLSSGEQISAGLFATALCEVGIAAESLLGWQVPIVTDCNYSCAKICDIDTQIIMQKLQNGIVVVIPGFQGVYNDAITTFGRGGSDITAVALAKALSAKDCQIYKDVDGILPVHPKILNNQNPFKSIGYDQILEMSLGKDVLHNRAIDIARNNNINLKVASSFDIKKTQQTNLCQNIEEDFFWAITHKEHNIIAKSKNYTHLFDTIEKNKIAIHSFCLFHSESCVIFPKDQYCKINQADKINQINDIEFIFDIAVIYIVGSSAISKTINIAKILDLLSGIQIQFFSTTEIKVTIAIHQNDMQNALNALYSFLNDSKANLLCKAS